MSVNRLLRAWIATSHPPTATGDRAAGRGVLDVEAPITAAVARGDDAAGGLEAMIGMGQGGW